MDPASAGEQASREWDEMEKARQTGVFRDTFKEGVRAALDGDLKGWMKNWWKDRVAKGMEEALNSLSDLIANLFANAGRNNGSGGGILGSIAKIVGGAIGGGSLGGVSASSQSYLDGLSANLGTAKDLPGFKTGGTGVIKGRPGIDANMVSFRATAGEIVNIQRPGNDIGGRVAHFDLRGAVLTQDLLNQMNVMADGAALRGAAGGSSMAQSSAAARARRRIPGR